MNQIESDQVYNQVAENAGYSQQLQDSITAAEAGKRSTDMQWFVQGSTTNVAAVLVLQR